jgi:4-hydroxy-tetrahydrodipicolinate synthase
LAARELVSIVRLWESGDREAAEAGWESLLPLLHYENRQCGLSAAKAVLAEGGVIRSGTTRAPFPVPRPQSLAELIRLARKREIFALNWA